MIVLEGGPKLWKLLNRSWGGVASSGPGARPMDQVPPVPGVVLQAQGQGCRVHVRTLLVTSQSNCADTHLRGTMRCRLLLRTM